MKIGIYIDRMDLRGGVQRVVSNLCHGWILRGWEVHVITVSGGAAAFSLPEGVVLHKLMTRGKRRGWRGLLDNLSHVRRLGCLVREQHLAAVLAISVVANIHLALASLPSQVVRIGSEHSYPPHFPLKFYWEWFRRLAYPRLDAVVCPTREAAAYISRTYSGTRTFGIPNWLTWPLPVGEGARSNVARRQGRRLFVACGRLDKLKGFAQLIRIFATLKNRLPAWDLLIVGDGEERARLEAQVDQSMLRERVFFAGWVADMEAVYQSADLFLFPSVSEGFALVLAEAMACGLPCVSYDCRVGPAEIIRDGVDGVLVPLGDEKGFSDAMLHLAIDDAERTRLASRCNEILNRLSEVAIQPLWEEVLRSNR